MLKHAFQCGSLKGYLEVSSLHAAAARELSTTTSAALQSPEKEEPPVPVLLPMPSLNALAGISNDEAFAPRCALETLDEMQSAVASASPVQAPVPAGIGSAAQTMERSNSLLLPFQSSLPQSELPLLVCPNSLTLSFCEVKKNPQFQMFASARSSETWDLLFALSI